MTGWPSASPSAGANTRASVSVAPPGGLGTSRRIGRAGYWAMASPAKTSRSSAARGRDICKPRILATAQPRHLHPGLAGVVAVEQVRDTRQADDRVVDVKEQLARPPGLDLHRQRVGTLRRCRVLAGCAPRVRIERVFIGAESADARDRPEPGPVQHAPQG